MTADDESVGATSSALRLHAVTALIVAATVAMWFGYTRFTGIENAPFHLPLWILFVAFTVTELSTVHIESRGVAYALTFSEIATIASLALADPGSLVLARMLSGVVVLGLVRRQSFNKLSFNLALFSLEAVVAASVFALLIGDSSPVEVGGWPAVFIGLLTATVVSTIAVTIAITVFSGWPGRQVVGRVLAFGSLFCLGNTATGLVVVAAIWDRSYSGLLVAAVIAALFLLYRAHMGLTERHKGLETLHDFTRSLAGSEIEALERAVVLGAREILRGEQGALLLPPVRIGVPATRVIARGDEVTRSSISQEELDTDLRRILPTGAARLYSPGQSLPGWLGELGVKDAAIVPLLTDGVVVGAMVVANRLTEVSTFVEEDLQLFETLANHANVALANGRLVATLQYDAQVKAYQGLHDRVTGLPNRTSLEEELMLAIRAAKLAEQRVGLVFVDLDTFKEVTDTLGITTSDRILVEVRDRLAALLPERAQLLRFTGDQFAVLVTGVVDEVAVLDLAETIRGEFDTPFTSEDVSLVLGASVGIALFPDHAMDGDTLIKRADAATYMARLEGSGIEVYAVEADPYAPRRLALAAELSAALENDEVDVYVQPKMRLPDGKVVGAEALVRWTHPRLGPLFPDQFIPAAEHTGVIRPLTLYVVKHALAQCRGWRDAGFDLSIAVNLSVRNLFDSHLVEDIGRAIEESGVPATALTLELTESTVMGESRRSMAVLNGLHDLGVRLSVDDFGTGYSSLTHLRRLPVTELKIDKSFVMTMTTNDQDAVIVRALVDLGRSLGLRTVAEGVESPDALALLRTYDCDEAQGYLFSRPLPAEQFVTWLERQDVRRFDRSADVVQFLRDKRRAVGDDLD